MLVGWLNIYLTWNIANARFSRSTYPIYFWCESMKKKWWNFRGKTMNEMLVASENNLWYMDSVTAGTQFGKRSFVLQTICENTKHFIFNRRYNLYTCLIIVVTLKLSTNCKPMFIWFLRNTNTSKISKNICGLCIFIGYTYLQIGTKWSSQSYFLVSYETHFKRASAISAH